MARQISLASLANEQAKSFPEKRWALVVGVNQAPYSNKGPLDYAVNDARQVAAALQDHCGFTLVREPLLDDAARSSDVLQAITRELIANRGDDDFLLLYFSGHGIAYRRGETVEKTDIYLGTADFSPQDVEFVHDAHLSLKLLHDLLFTHSHAGKVLIILDCCYAGNFSGYGADLTLDELRNQISYYFDLNLGSAATMHGLRLALAATAYDRSTVETVTQEHGLLTQWLLPALSGEASEAIDYAGHVTFYSLRTYLQDKMRDYPPSGSGADAGRECILAYHSKHPVSYFPYGHDTLFRPRMGEFETLEPLLRSAGTEQKTPVRLGLVGMGGVGKSQLARELVYRTRDHFTDGVFWVAAAEDQAEKTAVSSDKPLVHPLAKLADRAHYLPPGDDNARPNKERRASYLCHFLAKRPHALLILDNLEDPDLITTVLPELAGSELECTILYTSRKRDRPRGTSVHSVEPLREQQDLLALLFEDVDPDVLTREGAEQRDKALEAARSICQRVGGLPLALTLLRSQLEKNAWLALTDLDSQLRRDGVLAVAYDESSIHKSLEAAFRLSWQHVNDAIARNLFLLAAYFPAATPIPLWLLALACGVDEDYGLRSPLIITRGLLRSLSLVEDVSREEIQIHSLLREFGQKLVDKMPDGAALRQAATERVISTFEDVLRLEQRARNAGFWDCLAQVRAARMYVSTLLPGMEERLRRVERRLDQESYFLATSGFWPEKIPGLFYQQMYNCLLEEEQPLPPHPPVETRWLRQVERVGIQDTGLLRVFSGHSKGVNSVAFSPDGSRVLTGSEDTTARIFETASGRTLHVLSGHKHVIDSVAYSPDGLCVLTGSRDHTARLWDAESGECIRLLEGHTDWVNAVAFSPDNKFILTGSQDATARLWERASDTLYDSLFLDRLVEKQVQTNLWDESNYEKPAISVNAITCVSFSADSKQVALGTASGSVTLWNIAERTSTTKYFSVPISSIVFSPNNTLLLFGFDDGSIQLCSKEQMTPIAEYHIHGGKVSSIAFSHDPAGTYILTGSWDSDVVLWMLENDALLLMNTFVEHAGKINSITFSNDDTLILSGLSDATAQIRMSNIVPSPISDESPLYKPGPNFSYISQSEQIASAVFSPDGSQLLVINHFRDIHSNFSSWDIRRRQKLQTFSMNPDVLNTILAFNGEKIVQGVAHVPIGTHVRNGRTGDFLCFLQGHTGPILCSAISPDSWYILTGSTDTTIRLWNANTGRTLHTLKGHTDHVTCVAFSPDGTQLLTGSRDRTARLWKRHGRAYIPVILGRHDGTVTSVSFSPDGKSILTGSANGILSLWNTTDGTLRETLDGQASSLNIIACSPANRFILTGHQFNQIRLWERDEYGLHRLVGAYATHKMLMAMCWQNDQDFLLADNGWNEWEEDFPRVYTLRLET